MMIPKKETGHSAKAARNSKFQSIKRRSDYKPSAAALAAVMRFYGINSPNAPQWGTWSRGTSSGGNIVHTRHMIETATVSNNPGRVVHDSQGAAMARYDAETKQRLAFVIGGDDDDR
jgi:hypothetical protein